MEVWHRWRVKTGLGWLGLAAAIPVLAGAEGLWVDGYITDGCVLQRKAVLRIGGGATPGKRVEVMFRGEVHGTTSEADGRWEVACGPYEAGGPDPMEILSEGETIRVKKVLVGDVWIFLGQSNMAYTMAPYLPWTEGVPEYEEAIVSVDGRGISLMTQPRFVHHEPWDRVEGTWRAASPESVRHFSAVAWYTLSAMREASAVPLGGIVAAIGSTGIESWLPGSPLSGGQPTPDSDELGAFRSAIRTYCEEFRASTRLGERPKNQGPDLHEDYLYTPSGCYNALVHPLTRYPVAGWVWYQGEGNAKRAAAYRDQLARLIGAYRDLWGQAEAPFIVVQLPGYRPPEDPTGETWAALREAQRQVVLKTPRTALVTTLDVGDADRIHPRDKKPVGHRCARAAITLKAAPEGRYGNLPTKALLHTDGSVELSFTGHEPMPEASPDLVIEGLWPDGQRRQAHSVQRHQDRLRVVFDGPSGGPSEIRYAYENLPTASLFQADGAPVSPFMLSVSTTE